VFVTSAIGFLSLCAYLATVSLLGFLLMKMDRQHSRLNDLASVYSSHAEHNAARTTSHERTVQHVVLTDEKSYPHLDVAYLDSLLDFGKSRSEYALMHPSAASAMPSVVESLALPIRRGICRVALAKHVDLQDDDAVIAILERLLRPKTAAQCVERLERLRFRPSSSSPLSLQLDFVDSFERLVDVLDLPTRDAARSSSNIGRGITYDRSNNEGTDSQTTPQTCRH